MSVSLVTFRKGATSEAMIAATRKLKVVLEKHGAERVTLANVTAGPDAGQWVIRIVCANWEAFGKAMHAGTDDPAVREAVAGLDAVAEMVSRRMIATVDL